MFGGKLNNIAFFLANSIRLNHNVLRHCFHVTRKHEVKYINPYGKVKLPPSLLANKAPLSALTGQNVAIVTSLSAKKDRPAADNSESFSDFVAGQQNKHTKKSIKKQFQEWKQKRNYI